MPIPKTTSHCRQPNHGLQTNQIKHMPNLETAQAGRGIGCAGNGRRQAREEARSDLPTDSHADSRRQNQRRGQGTGVHMKCESTAISVIARAIASCAAAVGLVLDAAREEDGVVLQRQSFAQFVAKAVCLEQAAPAQRE